MIFVKGLKVLNDLNKVEDQQTRTQKCPKLPYR